ncbi:hypothetical protein [Tsuneonella mangrovi]|uniref:hypothetical protein n=1 Tax=Tsuneonella mangrovi TaxID=1982042 RepID=UPI0012372F1A|nr:hypothetical protein [Tsuneonella mangrovi]
MTQDRQSAEMDRTLALETYLEAIADNAESYFQSHLAKEDLAKVQRLKGMAIESDDLAQLQHDALYIGWTPGDLRTGELKEQLLPLIAAMHAAVRAQASEAESADAALLDAWKVFHEARIKVLIHCL